MLCWRFTIHNTLSNIYCVGGKTCRVGGLPYTTHFHTRQAENMNLVIWKHSLRGMRETTKACLALKCAEFHGAYACTWCRCYGFVPRITMTYLLRSPWLGRTVMWLIGWMSTTYADILYVLLFINMTCKKLFPPLVKSNIAFFLIMIVIVSVVWC